MQQISGRVFNNANYFENRLIQSQSGGSGGVNVGAKLYAGTAQLCSAGAFEEVVFPLAEYNEGCTIVGNRIKILTQGRYLINVSVLANPSGSPVSTNTKFEAYLIQNGDQIGGFVIGGSGYDNTQEVYAKITETVEAQINDEMYVVVFFTTDDGYVGGNFARRSKLSVELLAS